MHPDSVENLVSAELEYRQNRQNPLYDFSFVVVKYSKTIECEVCEFARTLFAKLGDKNSQILNIKFTIQEREFCIADIFHMRPNLGTFQYLFRHHSVKRAVVFMIILKRCASKLMGLKSLEIMQFTNERQNLMRFALFARKF